MERFKRMLWWLIGGTEGGRNRLRIILALQDSPRNANQLSEDLDLNYKTIKHHIELMDEHDVITTMGDGYGKNYFLTERMENHMEELNEIIEQAGMEKP